MPESQVSLSGLQVYSLSALSLCSQVSPQRRRTAVGQVQKFNMPHAGCTDRRGRQTGRQTEETDGETDRHALNAQRVGCCSQEQRLRFDLKLFEDTAQPFHHPSACLVRMSLPPIAYENVDTSSCGPKALLVRFLSRRVVSLFFLRFLFLLIPCQCVHIEFVSEYVTYSLLFFFLYSL